MFVVDGAVVLYKLLIYAVDELTNEALILDALINEIFAFTETFTVDALI